MTAVSIAWVLAGALAGERPLPPPTDPSALPLPDPNPRRPKRPPAERFGTAAYRAHLPADGPAVSSRLALVQDFDGPSIGELTVRVQQGWHSFAVAAEIAGTAGASSTWSSAGLGNLVLDARGLFGRGATHALGLRAVLPVGVRGGPRGPVRWWGTVPDATVPTGGLAIAYELAAPRVVAHAHVGFKSGSGDLGPVPDLSLAVATIQPVAPRWEVVAEMEALSGESPLHVRALARHTFAEA
ncbi:MAG: hypothetical protein ACK4YP_17985, partial [Myxococcota bacterium]